MKGLVFYLFVDRVNQSGFHSHTKRHPDVEQLMEEK